MPVVVLRQVPGLMVQKTVVRPQLPSIYGRRHSLSSSRGSSPWSRLFTRPQRFSSCCLISGGRCSCCAGRAVSPVLPWRRSWRSHSCSSLRNRRPFFPDCSKLRTFRSCSSSTSSSTSLSCRKRRSSWSRLFSRPQSFTVAVRFRCSFCCVGRAVFLLVVAGPRSSASWPVWTKRTVTVACTILVMPVAMHLALFFVPVCRPMLLGIMAFLGQPFLGQQACGSGMCKAGIADFHALRAVFP